jgi:Peptidase MA superfamily
VRKGLSKGLAFIFLCIILVLSIFSGACGSALEAIPTPTSTVSIVITPTPTFVPATPTPTPTAVSGQIDIVSSTTENSFPSSLTFSIEAQGPDEISQIVLRYKVKKISLAQVATEVEPEFEGGNRVEASWTWDTRKASLPPGAEIQYQWLVKDSAGRKAQTSWATLVFQDLRHDWETLFKGNVSIYWYNGSQSFGQQLMDAAQGGLEKLVADTGAHLEKPVKVYIYGSQQALLDALIYSYSWQGGGAFTDYGIVVLGVAPDDLEWGKRAMVHELAHLVTYQMTFNPYGDIPTWLNEGISMYAEGTLEEGYQSVLAKAVSEGELISVQSLSSSFPADPERATLAYAESYSLVDFLIYTYGQEKMLELLAVFKEGTSYDNALQKVYSFDTNGLEQRWWIYIGAS